MGVHSFWDIVGPTAKPVRLESLHDRRMAVDASIWIYQFLKAVRDKEGNAIKSAHITGFFRRVCKLLYFGIKPVFVFDGGVPVLKRKTIQKRKERREGKRDNATNTAKKILAKQLQTLKDNGAANEQLQSNASNGTANGNTSKVFTPFDEWDLPDIPGFRYSRSDERVNAADDFEKLINSIDTDVIDDIDLDSINPASKEFEELPKTTQFMILSTLRLRSRLRMGYSKEQLENIFPNSMDFSKFQIDMLKRRNFFTQKLINVTGMNDGGASKLEDEDSNGGSRLSSTKDKEYKLVKTENGWSLGFGDVDGSEANKAILLDDPEHSVAIKMEKDMGNNLGSSFGAEDEDGEEEFDWEDVDLKPAPQRKVEDYSLKAARKLTTGAGSEIKRAAVQSFLDTRPSDISPRKRKAQEQIMKPIHIEEDTTPDLQNENVAEVLSTDDSEGEYEQQMKEIELMENFKKKRNLKEQLNDSATNESIMRVDNNYKVNEQPIIRGDRTNQPVLTESEQNLRFIVNKIPTLDGGGSLLFGPNVEKPVIDDIDGVQKVLPAEEGEKRDREVPEIPSWFTNDSFIEKSNPYTANQFVNDIDLKPNADEISKSPRKEEYQLLSGLAATDAINELSSTRAPNDVVEVGAFQSFETPSQKAETAQKSSSDEEDYDDEQVRKPEVFDYNFSEEEEEELAENLRREEEDFREFRVTALNNKDVSQNAFIEDEIYAQQVKDKRDADEVTMDMIKDVQELLARFGIPYITAPMEAEAQCAELVNLKLVDGIITDDSDVFLFGGKKVYKNMFQEKNYVEYYDSEDIYQGLGLTRETMIELAQLLGSDYTTGIKGMGPVSSMEILAEFGDLKNFKRWYNEGQFDKKKQEGEDKFRRDLRKKLVKNDIILDDDFPSVFVADSYLNPEVDHDKTPFTWANPDLDMLRQFLYSYLGWPQEKSDEVLIPLIRDINARKKAPKQSTLTDFFPREYLDHKKLNLGKRITTATGKLKQRRLK
ncbi:DNA repair protein RAD2 [Nakaseomyces glabratus]|uniref:DNA repair protein RAD2 n=1 Tax=Candida glabrata TaxID=5478 RepID=A0A0W0CGR3_CANGB|nr:DNA repair protein RAD2 [Nakaseomyces glabratus]KTA97976.1 DNA repair protein RAD2 [Nakaseomyces glabratus]KTA98746.1 DNA repair protein RAD2 [Nakaseomyces glabratus]KTB14812.1 DNA repair protein RAD2 [Nakaseomyces glabratus]